MTKFKVGDRVEVIAPGAWHGVEGTIIEEYWIDASAPYDWRVEVETAFYRRRYFKKGIEVDRSEEYLPSALPFAEEELELKGE
jgi:hypothetical protein